MADHYPLPPELDDAVTRIVELIAKPTDASEAVHVIAQVLGRAYNAGHRAGTVQHLRLRWNEHHLEQKRERGAAEHEVHFRGGPTEDDLAAAIAQHRYTERGLKPEVEVQDIDICRPLARAILAVIEQKREETTAEGASE